jgi:hypothetical protein
MTDKVLADIKFDISITSTPRYDKFILLSPVHISASINNHLIHNLSYCVTIRNRRLAVTIPWALTDIMNITSFCWGNVAGLNLLENPEFCICLFLQHIKTDDSSDCGFNEKELNSSTLRLSPHVL